MIAPRLITGLSDPPSPIQCLYNVNDINSNDIVHVYDAFDLDEFTQEFDQRGWPGAVFNDHWSWLEWPSGPKIYCCPVWLAQQARRFQTVTLDDRIDTRQCCAIMVNKPQLNRTLALRLAQLFDLDIAYTWKGLGQVADMQPIIDEINTLGKESPVTQQDRSFLINAITLEPRWIEYHGGPVILDGTKDVRITYGGNSWTWNNGLNEMFSSSAVAIITESLQNQVGMVFTEKTAYSLLGLNFPIWIGGHRQADTWESHGFDAFKDVVDHSYQHYSTMIERCWWAIKLNLPLLKDRDFAHAQRIKHRDRLLKNRELLLSGQLDRVCERAIDSWPPDISWAAREFISKSFLSD